MLCNRRKIRFEKLQDPFCMPKHNHYSWLKNKGYIHVTPKIDVHKNPQEIIRKVSNRTHVAQYGFFPLIHSIIQDRRYKKKSIENAKRSHTSIDKEGRKIKNVKRRPLHYATHMDALIFGYYAHLLYEKYENELKKTDGLSDCITAYRKISIPNSKSNKSTIHFAKEVFEEIEKRSTECCSVLKFDIKSFFNEMNHGQLKKNWIDILKLNDDMPSYHCDLYKETPQNKLPADHFNVYNATTRFSYILRDDFRVKKQTNNARRTGFDEKKLAYIRNKFGKESFFQSIEEFRQALKTGQLKIHKFPFRGKDGLLKGIPQGLPISAVLANLYLLNFDKGILEKIVKKRNGYYRRYSDDIVIICKLEEKDDVIDIVMEEIANSKVEISKEKTEVFFFKEFNESSGVTKIKSVQFLEKVSRIGIPFTYLGFEFYGHKTAIKSANLAKFYRRMIVAAKRKVKRAFKVAKNNAYQKPVIFFRQLYRLYTLKSLSQMKLKTKIKKLELNEKGTYDLKSEEIPSKFQSNYLTYVNRVASIMKQSNIVHQVKRHKKVLKSAINRQMSKEKSKY